MKRYPVDRILSAEERLRDALRDASVVFAYLHGSAAEGRPFRDLDVAVMAEASAATDPLGLMFSLGDRLERACGLPVDVHVLNQAPVGFAYHAGKGRLLVCRDEDAWADWRERVWNEYFDMEPYLRDMARASLGLL